MSTATLQPRVHAPRNYLNTDYGWKSWLFTLDHKRIAFLYMVSVTFFFIIGGSFAVLMRIHLVEPQGALVQPETYNKLFTLHGVVMIFFFLIPSIPAVLGNFLVPLMIGARDLAFPKLNLLSWYIYIVGGLFTLYSAIAERKYALVGSHGGPYEDTAPQAPDATKDGWPSGLRHRS